MANPCKDCPTNCCLHFGITTDIYNPHKTEEILQQYQFIHRVSRVLTYVAGKERMVGEYTCDRFNLETQTCIGYETIPRPSICEDTGTKYITFSKCLLKPTRHTPSELHQ